MFTKILRPLIEKSESELSLTSCGRYHLKVCKNKHVTSQQYIKAYLKYVKRRWLCFAAVKRAWDAYGGPSITFVKQNTV